MNEPTWDWGLLKLKTKVPAVEQWATKGLQLPLQVPLWQIPQTGPLMSVMGSAGVLAPLPRQTAELGAKVKGMPQKVSVTSVPDMEAAQVTSTPAWAGAAISAVAAQAPTSHVVNRLI
ncbi:MAG TPA: hypothetical protein VGO93_31895 [Candidatus Xenobia bacterium]|jgi:hypothetical protein